MKYTCENHRPVTADSMNDAAEAFATRKARGRYGRRAYARTCNKTAWSQDGALGEYCAFIGYRSGHNETTGHNVRFTVRRVGGAA